MKRTGTKGEAVQESAVTIETIPPKNGQIGGRIEMSEEVVATIAGMVAREVSGIHSLGKSRFLSIGKDDPKRGVGAEVGVSEAALDLEVIVDYACDIRRVASELRQKIAAQVDRMAGRKVIEVNVRVLGIHVPEAEDLSAPVIATGRVN
jgi:uncharacterized alkaline shock family protein YloU